MKNVYFAPINSYSDTENINKRSAELLSKFDIKPQGEIPLKVHFGEKNNVTFIGPENYLGIISHLHNIGLKPFYTDTNVLYKGERTISETHIKLAMKHGFSQIPVKIADGYYGDEIESVDIDQKHFKTCKIGKLFADFDEMIVISHFKGHIIAGFGGAIKQLSMGCAARGGKLDMHSNSKPMIVKKKCIKCGICIENCPTNAIFLNEIIEIDFKKCIGCAKCIAVCPERAASINWGAAKPSEFVEKLAEYALAASKNKRNIYINFLLNITKECDCMGIHMTPIAKDIGILASDDPVAIDRACYDLLNSKEGRKVFGGENIFDYAEKIGLGEKNYDLITT